MTTQAKTNARTAQMDAHGVDRARYPFASFVAGRGWKGHKTAEKAHAAALRDARRQQSQFGGGYPQAIAADTATGATV